MKPIVVICTHGRLLITSYNIQSLLRQSVVPEIVLVVSDRSERAWYAEQFPGIHLIIHPNIPLGYKWQVGVQYAHRLKADPLIILGSDDILGPKYIENCTELTGKSHDFVGLFQWYMHHEGKAYLCDYLARIPLGGGRAYSGELLSKLKGVLFDTYKNKHLDDFGYAKAARTAFRELKIFDARAMGMEIHSIKGDWAMINKFSLQHKNIRPVKVFNSRDLLPDLPLWSKHSYANDDLA